MSDTFPLINLLNYYSNLHSLLRAMLCLMVFISMMKHNYNTAVPDGNACAKIKKYSPESLRGFSYALVQAA